MRARCFMSTAVAAGVDFGSTGVKLVETAGGARDGRGACELRVARLDAGTATTVEATRAVLRAAGWRSRRCRVNLPRDAVRPETVQLPASMAALSPAALAAAAARILGVDPGTNELRCSPTGGRGPGGRGVFQVAIAPHAVTRPMLEWLEACGLRPDTVDLGGFGLGRLAGRQKMDKMDAMDETDVVRAVLDVGHDGSTLVIARGGVPEFVREIATGGIVLDRAIARRLDVDESTAATYRRARRVDADAGSEPPSIAEATSRPLTDLATEVRQCLRTYGASFPGPAPDRVVLVGGSATEPGLADRLAEAIRRPATLHDDPALRAAIRRAPDVDDHEPTGAWSLAESLARAGTLVTQRDPVERTAA